MQTGHLVLIVIVAATSCCPHLLISSADELNSASYTELQEQWQRLSDNVDVDQVNPPPSTRYLTDEEGADSVPDVGPESPVEIDSVPAADQSDSTQISESLLAWISNQCENMIEEIEAIAKQNAVAKSFSPVNYLRYLFLYERLRTITKQPYKELKWVKRKINIFGSVYKQSLGLLRSYLEMEHLKLLDVEEAEPKSKQVGVSDSWMEHYLNIRYIAVHAPKQSELAKTAVNWLSYAPDNNPLKQRSARFEVKTRAFSR